MRPEPLDSQDGCQERPRSPSNQYHLDGFLEGSGLSDPAPPARGSKELRWPFVRPQGPGSHPCPEGHSGNGEQCWGGSVGSRVENLLGWRPQAPAHMVQAWRGLTRFPERRPRLALAALLLCRCVWPAGFHLCAKPAALLGPGWQRPSAWPSCLRRQHLAQDVHRPPSWPGGFCCLSLGCSSGRGGLT